MSESKTAQRTRQGHVRDAYRQLEAANEIGKSIDNPPKFTGGNDWLDRARSKQLLCYAEATAHFAAAAIPDLEQLQAKIAVGGL